MKIIKKVIKTDFSDFLIDIYPLLDRSSTQNRAIFIHHRAHQAIAKRSDNTGRKSRAWYTQHWCTDVICGHEDKLCRVIQGKES